MLRAMLSRIPDRLLVSSGGIAEALDTEPVAVIGGHHIFVYLDTLGMIPSVPDAFASL